MAWLAFNRDAIPPTWMAAPFLGFLALVVVHARVIGQNERAARARRLYQRGADRLEGRWTNAGPDGARFLAGHPYARDLDLFGPASLFQLLHTVRTEAGEDTLAGWLRDAAAVSDIRARQAAVAELRPRVDFREDLAVLAAEAHVGQTTALAKWAAAQPAGLTAIAAAVLGACAAVSAALIGAGILEISAVVSGQPAPGRVTLSMILGWLVIQAAIAALWRRKVHDALLGIDAAAYDLTLLTGLLQRVEREPFTSPLLSHLHAALVADSVPASKCVVRLLSFVSVLDNLSLNLLMSPVGRLLLVRSQIAAAIDRWRAAHGRALVGWLRTIGELEALACFATYAYEHPDDPFPSLSDDSAVPIVEAVRLAHPLIVERDAVPNDVKLGGVDPHVLIVSGSNMSGKSTLLRAVGVNAVLALAGAPVRAARMTISPVAIGATLRIEDSLQAGHSRFYSEILRIRAIVGLAREGRPLLFLLDEILHGTNSYDRRIGAEAIVKALVDAGSIGLVTTHDLALTELVASLNGRAANVHFEDRLEDGKIVFDYRMREGVVERSNALALMRAIGLDV
jgi:MutS-like protein